MHEQLAEDKQDTIIFSDETYVAVLPNTQRKEVLRERGEFYETCNLVASFIRTCTFKYRRYRILEKAIVRMSDGLFLDADTTPNWVWASRICCKRDTELH